MEKERLQERQDSLSGQNDAGQPTEARSMAPGRKKSPLRRLAPALAAAACLVCVAGLWKFGPLRPEKLTAPAETNAAGQIAENGVAGQAETTANADADAAGKSADAPEEGEGGSLPQTAASYDEIYQTIHAVQARRQALREQYATDYDGGVYYEMEAADGAAPAAGGGAGAAVPF